MTISNLYLIYWMFKVLRQFFMNIVVIIYEFLGFHPD